VKAATAGKPPLDVPPVALPLAPPTLVALPPSPVSVPPIEDALPPRLVPPLPPLDAELRPA